MISSLEEDVMEKSSTLRLQEFGIKHKTSRERCIRGSPPSSSQSCEFSFLSSECHFTGIIAGMMLLHFHSRGFRHRSLTCAGLLSVSELLWCIKMLLAPVGGGRQSSPLHNPC